MSAAKLVEHFFRHEYGRLVAVLTRQVGVARIQSVEDAVQAALTAALESWTTAALPENPEAWLYRVARNRLIDDLRERARRGLILDRLRDGDIAGTDAIAETLAAGQVEDDLLRMLFMCCDEALPAESQLVLALKVVCGFDVREIAQRLFSSEAHVYKRLARARERLRSRPPPIEGLLAEQYSARLPAVQNILYLLFTEGHLSSHAELTIRRELCEEAVRLTQLLAEHPAGRMPETCALLALMHLHSARLDARQDAGGLLLLEEQDRSRWDVARIQIGLEWLAQSAQGEVFSRFHAEAAIAAEHCLASSFAQTRWDKIAEHYALLEKLAPSALHTVNRALAVAQWRGPEAGLALLEGFEPPSWLAASYLWSAVLADLHRRVGHEQLANQYRDAALGATPTAALRRPLHRRLTSHDS